MPCSSRRRQPDADARRKEAVCALAHAAGAKVVLDNVFATHRCCSAASTWRRRRRVFGDQTHGRSGAASWAEPSSATRSTSGPVQTLMRHTGPAMNPFNAWTLLRAWRRCGCAWMRRSRRRWRSLSSSTRTVESRGPKYPFLKSHPQYDLARKADGGRRHGGDVRDRRPQRRRRQRASLRGSHKLRVAKISNNLGDSKTLVTHPATTTHRAMGPEGAQPSASPIRSCGSPSGWRTPRTLINDLDQALGRSISADRRGVGTAMCLAGHPTNNGWRLRPVDYPDLWKTPDRAGLREVWDPWRSHLRNPALTGL